MKKFRLIVWISMLIALFVPVLSLASSIAQTYKSVTPLDAGTVVSIDVAKGEVTPASTLTTNTLIGVVISRESSTLSLGDTESSLLVARSGNVTTFVSDINGPIKAGDKITASPISGVGMKALSAGRVIGTAEGAIVDGSQQEVKDKKGKSHNITVGRISLMVEVGNYSPADNTSKSYIPASLRNLAIGIAGKDVAAWRIIAAVIIIVATLAIVVAFVYSSIRTSLIAIGRNPLSAPSIYRNVGVLLVITLAILIGSLLAAYGIIKL